MLEEELQMLEHKNKMEEQMLQEELQKERQTLEHENKMLKELYAAKQASIMAATQNSIAQGQTVDGGESLLLFKDLH